jgi:uncharacterized membrane protein
VNRKPGITASVVGIAFMAAVTLWAWPQVPGGGQIAIHWNAAGNPDGYASKEVALLALPILAVLIAVLLAVIPQFEPRRLNLAQSGKAYLAAWIGTLVVLAGAQVLLVLAAVGRPANVVTIASLLAGGLLIVVGNYLGKARSNWFFGIRNPWTRSATVFAAVLLVLLALIVIVTVYSYIVWRDDPLKHPLGR